MRQAFLEFPWVHAPAPKTFFYFFRSFGRLQRLRPGQSIFNGGPEGEVGFLLSGLCAYRMQNSRDQEHWLTLVPEGRLIGDIDAFTGAVVNILDYALRPSEMLIMERHTFFEKLRNDPAMGMEHAQTVAAEHESDLEGMFSAVSDPLIVRIAKLFAALCFRDEPRERFNWHEAKARFRPQPVPYALTPTEIAKLVGASRTAVSLCLTRCEKEGLLRTEGGVRVIMPAMIADLTDWLTEGAKPIVRHSRRRSS
jgi:CRP-like cAMP-binding protein